MPQMPRIKTDLDIPLNETFSYGHDKWHSPVNPRILEFYLYLADYDLSESQFLVKGFSEGFTIGHYGALNNTIVENDVSISLLHDEALEKVLKEVNLGRIDGPFEGVPACFKDDFHCSPCKIIPKKSPGNYRLLHNYSYPYDQSAVNSNILDVYKRVRYESVRDAVKKICNYYPGLFMAKDDIEDAFRLLPLHYTEFKKLLFSIGDYVYCDLAGSMGCSSICQLWERFATALHYMAKNVHLISSKFCASPVSLELGVNSLFHRQDDCLGKSAGDLCHMADDFLLLNQSEVGCRIDQSNFHWLCHDLGVPIAWDKSCSPATNMDFLGISFDTQNESASIPHEKVAQYLEDISEFLKLKRVSLKQCQSLAGKLSFAASVVQGRAFLRRLFELIATVARKNNRFLFVNGELRKDLVTWQTFLCNYNCLTFYRLVDPFVDTNIVIESDASNIGFGLVYGSVWIQGYYPAECSAIDFNTRELYPVLVIMEMLGQSWQNSVVRFVTDNSCTLGAINNQSSKSKSSMIIIRRLVILLLKWNIHLKAQHIAGKKNILPDRISRFAVSSDLLRAYNMNDTPLQIPQHLWPTISTFKC